MDDFRFDALARRAAANRRVLFDLLASGTLAALAARLDLPSVDAKKHKKGKKKHRCTAQNCAHGCCKTAHGPCGSGITEQECGFGGKPCQVCRGTTRCREPERGGCCQAPSGECSATTPCCYAHAGQTACVEGKCCIISDGLACESSLDCCEPKPFCIGGKCTAGCLGEESRCGDSCCAEGERCYGTVCCPVGFGCTGVNGGLGSCCQYEFCCRPIQPGVCDCEFPNDGCCA